MNGQVYNQSDWIAVKAAQFYYEKGKSLKEVAETLNVSEATASRLLQRAKKEKIVEFIIRNPYKQCLELEGQILEKYKLKEVIIAPSLSEGSSEVEAEANKMKVALEGARYLQRIIAPEDILGIAWGGTMYYLIHYLNPCQRTDAAFVTLHGSLSCCDYELNVHTLVSRMSMAFGGRHYSLSSEGLQDTAQRVDLMKNRKNVKQIFSLFKQLTISVGGIGSFYPRLDSPLSRMQYLKPEELALLKSKGVYGDMMLRFFDKNGEECDSSLKDRTLAVDLGTYKRIPCKIIVASGTQKSKALKAALKGGLIDVLIVDSRLAEAVIIEDQI